MMFSSNGPRNLSFRWAAVKIRAGRNYGEGYMQTELQKIIAQRNTITPQKGPAHDFLKEFIGRWRVEGRNSPVVSGGAGEAVRGDEIFEWFEGEFFLINRFDRVTDSGHFSGLGWIGFDVASNSYLSYSVTNSGFLRIYQVEISQGQIRYEGKHERGIVKLSHDGGTMLIQWDQSGDGKQWKSLCDLEGHRLN
jgi:hypothetical protein